MVEKHSLLISHFGFACALLSSLIDASSLERKHVHIQDLFVEAHDIFIVFK